MIGSVSVFVFLNIVSLIVYIVNIVRINLDLKINLKLFVVDFFVAFFSYFMVAHQGCNDVFAFLFAIWCLLILGTVSFLNF